MQNSYPLFDHCLMHYIVSVLSLKAQGLGYQVEVVDLSENGPYPGSEATG